MSVASRRPAFMCIFNNASLKYFREQNEKHMSVILWAVPPLQLLVNKNDSFILLSSRETLFKKRKRYAFHEIISQ